MTTLIQNVNCVVIGQREFRNWSAYGALRVHCSRIYYYDGTEETFDILMNNANDFDNEIGMEYFFVVLNNDYQKDIIKYIGSEVFYLAFSAVNGLYALNDTAYKRMIGNANLAKVKLCLDENLTTLASQWKNKNKQVINHFKANRILEILGFDKYDYEQNNNPFDEYLKKDDLSDKNIVDRERTMAYAWSVSNYYISRVLGKKDELSELYRNNDNFILNFYNKLSKKDISGLIDLSLSSYPEFLDERKQAQEIIGLKDSILLFTLYTHYEMLITQYFNNMGEQIFLALVKDIVYIKTQYEKKDIVELIYWLSILLPEIFVSQLYYAYQKQSFKSIDVDLLDEAKQLLADINKLLTNNHSEQISNDENQKEYNKDALRKENNNIIEKESVNYVNNTELVNLSNTYSENGDANEHSKIDQHDFTNNDIKSIISKYIKDKNNTDITIAELQSKIQESKSEFNFYIWYNEQAKIYGCKTITKKTRKLSGIKEDLTKIYSNLDLPYE